MGMDGMVHSADAEYKFHKESKFRITTRPMHKLILVVPVDEQTFKEETKVMEDNNEGIGHLPASPNHP
jgi:hypothetical protein